MSTPPGVRYRRWTLEDGGAGSGQTEAGIYQGGRPRHGTVTVGEGGFEDGKRRDLGAGRVRQAGSWKVLQMQRGSRLLS